MRMSFKESPAESFSPIGENKGLAFERPKGPQPSLPPPSALQYRGEWWDDFVQSWEETEGVFPSQEEAKRQARVEGRSSQYYRGRVRAVQC